MSKTDWKEDYKQMKLLGKRQLELLDKGPNSLSSSWSLMAMYNDWRRLKKLE